MEWSLADTLAGMMDETHPMDFYRDLFPEGSFETKGIMEDGKYNGIAVMVPPSKDGSKPRIRRITVTDELDGIVEMIESDDFCIMSPISYAGKSRKSSMARDMYALAFDLDGVSSDRRLRYLLDDMIGNADERRRIGAWALPQPTYLVSSGTGLHLYYVFEKPIRMFPNIVKQLEAYKKKLTWIMWTQGASELHDSVQYESLFQGFRVVGTITKNGGRCKAYKFGSKVTMEYMNEFVDEPNRVTEFRYKSDLSLAEAKELYPDWYEKRIVQGQPKGTWQCHRGLYDWWKRRCNEPEEGHRYWYLMTLAVYARKCGISEEELQDDIIELVPIMDARGDSEFTLDEGLNAMAAYDDDYMTYPIHTIVKRTDMPIERNKRNGQRQVDHLEEARAVRDIRQRRKGLNWYDNSPHSGRKSKADIVAAWRIAHPEGRKCDCIRDTGLSKPTVYKWWKES